MPRMIATHDVDDVPHWLASPKREEVFAGIGSDIRTFVNPDAPNSVAVAMTVTDMDAFQELMQSDAAAAAMEYDGVRPETLTLYVES